MTNEWEKQPIWKQLENTPFETRCTEALQRIVREFSYSDANNPRLTREVFQRILKNHALDATFDIAPGLIDEVARQHRLNQRGS